MMTKSQRAAYFRDLWPAAARRQGWNVRDDCKRHEITLLATGSESTTTLTQHQITALFLYLRFLADPDDAALAREWAICRENPEKYNHLRQAEHWRRKAGYRHGNRLDRHRFGVHFDAEVDAAIMTEDEVNQYLMTQRARARARSEKKKVRRYQLATTDPF